MNGLKDKTFGSSKNLFLIMESENGIDNGYYFFMYLRDKHPEINVTYAVHRFSPNYKKIKRDGNVIFIHSIKFKLCALFAKYVIFSDYIRHNFITKGKRILLDSYPALGDKDFSYLSQGKFDLIFTSLKNEYDYIKNNTTYEDNQIKLLGQPKYDFFTSYKDVNPHQILVLPYESHCKSHYHDFEQTNYYKKWSSFLNHDRLHATLEKNDITLIFLPQKELKNQISHFKVNSDNIIVADYQKYDFTELISESALLITDYSPCSFDFAYMLKPVIYYQNGSDNKEDTYFNYAQDGFGKVCNDEESLLMTLNDDLRHKIVIKDIYENRSKAAFISIDAKNCERIYESIVQ